MKSTITLAAAVALLFGAIQTHGQSSLFDFQDGTDQGFGNGFGDDASKSFSIVNINSSLQMLVPRTGGFQEAGNQRGNDGSPFYNAMKAAAANEAGYLISYDYYIDTSAWVGGAGTFFQIGTYVNTGSGYYAQSGNQVDLNGTQVASGAVFTGTISFTMASAGFDMPAADTFFRLGLFENGNGSLQGAYFDNVIVTPVPEPSTIALAGLGIAGLLAVRRFRKS